MIPEKIRSFISKSFCRSFSTVLATQKKTTNKRIFLRGVRLVEKSTDVITAKILARQKHKMGRPTGVPIIFPQDLVKWVLSNQDRTPIENAIWVILMENMEKATNVNKEN